MRSSRVSAILPVSLMLACTGLFYAAFPARSEDLTAGLSPAEEVRGIVRARDEAWISSELPLPIVELPFREGDAFKKGDLLAAFDCSTLEAQLKGAAAKLREAEIGYRNSVQLKAHRAAGAFDVDLSKAKVDEAAAERDSAAASLSPCRIEAPFSGRMGQVSVHLHEVPDRASKMFEILDGSGLEVDMIVPARWLKSLSVGAHFSLHIEELDIVAGVDVTRIAAAVDAVSQTVKVVGTLSEPNPEIRPGMSGPIIDGPGA